MEWNGIISIQCATFENGKQNNVVASRCNSSDTNDTNSHIKRIPYLGFFFFLSVPPSRKCYVYIYIYKCTSAIQCVKSFSYMRWEKSSDNILTCKFCWINYVVCVVAVHCGIGISGSYFNTHKYNTHLKSNLLWFLHRFFFSFPFCNSKTTINGRFSFYCCRA